MAVNNNNNNLTPVLQVIDIKIEWAGTTVKGDKIEKRESYKYMLSDGSDYTEISVSDKIRKLIKSKKLQIGSIVQFTDYSYSPWDYMYLTVRDLNVICIKCDIIGYPKPFPGNQTSSEERSTPLIPDSYRVDPDLNEEVDDSHHAETPLASKQEPPASTLQGPSCSQTQTQSKKRKSQSSNHNITTAAQDIPKASNMTIEKNKEDDEMGACFEKLEKLGWGTQNPLYDTALMLFVESADYRKLWLLLKPESCWKWVKNVGSKYGLLG